METSKVLKIIAYGAGVTFLSSFFLAIISFFYRILLARSLGPSDYGLLMLAVAVLGIGKTISLLGLNQGVQRFIGHHIGLDNHSKVKGTIISSLSLVFVAGVVVGFFIFIFSRPISILFFDQVSLSSVLKLFSLMVPLYALIEIFKSVFLSFKKPIYYAIVNVVGEKALLFVLVAVPLYFGRGLFDIGIAYLLMHVITLALCIALLEFSVFPIRGSKDGSLYDLHELLAFSLPLLLVDVVNLILGWSDTFLIGYFIDSEAIGLYQVAFPLAYYLLIISRSFKSLYYPLAAQLFAQNKITQLTDGFNVITRWVFVIAFPLSLMIIWFSSPLIRFLFGQSYVGSSTALVILTIGMFAGVAVGPIDIVLQIYHRVKTIFAINICVACVNVTLNIFLIPIYGIQGAAFATAFSWTVGSLVSLLVVRSLITVSYDVPLYLRYIFSGVTSLAIVVLSIKFFIGGLGIVTLAICLVAYFGLYGLFLLVLGSFSKDDLMIMLAIEKRLGLNLEFAKKILRKFI